MIVTIVGLGLIGGSLALDLRANGFASKLIGVDASDAHCELALKQGLVDEIHPLEKACWESDVILLAIPVSAIGELFPLILEGISKHCVVIDMGSTKQEIAQLLAPHARRGRAVLAHPMAGTEYSGPQAAVKNLFQGRPPLFVTKNTAIRMPLR